MKEYFLEDLIQIKNGKDHKNLPDGIIPVYGSGGLMRYVNRSIYNVESILLPRKGTLTNIQYINKPFWTVDTLYYTIINKKKANPLYLYHYLKQLDLRYLNSGTGVPSMTFGAYYGIKVNLPELFIQQKIAKVLSDLDAKIDLNNKINTELEAMAKTLYEYWFIQFDFPDANGKPYKSSGGKMVYNDELKREIPEGWKNGNVMTLADLLGGGTPKTNNQNYWNGNIPFYTPADAENSIFVMTTKQYLTQNGLKSCSTKLYKKGTIFITARGTVGKVNIASKDMAMNQSCYAIQDKGNTNSPFLFFYISELVHYIKSKASGSIFSALVTNDFKFTEMVVPPENLIQKFGDFSENIFSKILNNKEENQQLASLRDWLLPMLMNGQVTVGETK